MIDLKGFYKGRDEVYGVELTEEIHVNVVDTVSKTNRLLERAGFQHIRSVNSGWRPRAVNEATPNAVPMSQHLSGRAIDLPDPDRTLAAWCVNHLEILSEIGLWMEDPRWTYDASGDHWVHLQIVPPKSGRRVFVPFDTPPLDPDFPVTWV